MSLLNPRSDDQVGRGRLALCLQAASLFVTGWFLWHATLAVHWLRLPLSWLVTQSVIYALTAWAAGAGITLTLYLLSMQWDRAEMIRDALRTSAAAVWFAPAVILLSQLSPAALAAALVLVIHTTRLLYSQWRTLQPEVPPAPATGLFASLHLPARVLWKQRAPALAASASVQTAVVAVLFHMPLMAGIGFAMCTAILTIFAITSGAFESGRTQSLPRSILGVLLTLLLAVSLTVAALLPRSLRGYGSGGSDGPPARHDMVDTARALLRELLYGEKPGAPAGALPGFPPGAHSALAKNPGFAAGGGIDAEGFPGVILWPEIKPVPTLIAPMPQVAGMATPALINPLSIPFSGEYWMFRWPYARPPGNSYFRRGSPAALSFSTSDHRPLQMEAHHKLDQAISLGCCSRIQLGIRNGDRYPGTVRLELVLINNELPGSPWQSLGTALVASVPDLKQDPVPPVPETLDFTIPAPATLESFNELKIVFLRARTRMDKSARVSVERFVLVPRIY